MINKIKNSITYKILLSFILLSLLMTLITTAISMWVQYEGEINKIQKEFKNIEGGFLPVIKEDLWEMDEDSIRVSLNGLLRLPNIEHVEIKHKERIIAAGGDRKSKKIVGREFPLYRDFDGKKIHVGTVYLVIGMNKIYAGLYKRALINLASNGLQILGVSLGMFLIVNFLVIKHLGAIADYFKTAEAGSLGKLTLRRHPLSRDSADEVSQIANAVNAMTARIKEFITELEAEIEGRKKGEAVRQKLEDQLQQSQKMEAIGTLTGGIAHDFNNILTAIIGYGNILKMKLAKDSPLLGYADQILSSAERAANLTHRLLAFSRKQVINLKPININEVVAGIEKFLLRIIGEDVELKTLFSGRRLVVMADAGQLEQVLMNLAANARDAMPNGGILEIETEAVEIDTDFLKIYEHDEHDKPGMYALISVTDTGQGMNEKTRQRIFEPFFTTKEVGKGTGLGLSMVYGIIKQHNGYINCYSEPGKGTTFKIYMPLIEGEPEKAKEEKHVPALRGTETILLAEDDEDVRKLTKIVLEEAGYRVVEAADGEEAVEKFKEGRDRINLLLLDVIMPVMSGKAVYEEAKKIKPGIKALFSSGYTADFIHRQRILEEGLNIISKPVPPHELLEKIREALERPKT